MAQLTMETEKYFKELKSGLNNLITIEDLSMMLRSKEKMVVLDIRKEEDYKEGHISGAFHTDWKDVGRLIEDDVFSKTDKVIVVCYTGQSAGQVVGILKSMGFDACSLKGGMVNGSENDNLPLEANCFTRS